MSALRAVAVVAAAVLSAACSHAESARDRGTRQAQLAVARELAARGAWSGVVGMVERIHARGGRSAETLTLRGVAYREQQLLDEAEADLRDAVAAGPAYAPAHAALAVLHDTRGEYDKGERLHRRAVELAPDDGAILNDWGFSLFLRGKHTEAVEVLRRATVLAPHDHRIRNNLGFAHARTGDFQRAARAFDMAGTPAEARNNLGFAYEAAGNLTQAYEAYAEAVRLDPGLRRARANLEHVARLLNRAVPPLPADAALSAAPRTP